MAVPKPSEQEIGSAITAIRSWQDNPDPQGKVLPLSVQGVQRKRHTILRVSDLLALPDDSDEWIVRDLFPSGQRIMVIGEGGSFKTSVVFDLAVAVASGGRMLNYLPVETIGPVLVVSTEGNVYANKKRLMMHIRAQNIDPQVIERTLRFCQEPFVLDDVMDAVELNEVVGKLRPALVVLDPLDSFFSGDENSAKETKAFRQVVNSLITNYGCSVLIIHHVGHGEALRPRGSSAWKGWADTIVHANKKQVGKGGDAFNASEWVVTKQRHGAEGHVFTIVPNIDPVFGLITFDFYDEGSSARVASRRMQQAIYQILKRGGNMTTGLIEENLPGMSHSKVREALDELQGLGLVDRLGEVVVPVAGRKPKTIAAWRALDPVRMIDGAAAVMRATALRVEADEKMLEAAAFQDTPSDEAPEFVGEVGGGAKVA